MTGGRRGDESFFERPILNSPYSYPPRHWELDEDGQPTNRLIETRRRSELITPAPKPSKRRRTPGPAALGRRLPSRNTTPPRSSTKSATTSPPGATCRTPTSGK